MNARYGLLMVMMEPPPAIEEEFNAWYDTEHLPERLALPGFLSGVRYVCLDGYPRYMALYDLASESVLESDTYLSVSGSRFSPWTKRVTSRMPGYRVAATQFSPGTAKVGRATRLLVIKLRDAADIDEQNAISAIDTILEGVPEVRQRCLFATSGASVDYFALVSLAGPPSRPIDLARAGSVADHVDMVNMYVPYSAAG